MDKIKRIYKHDNIILIIVLFIIFLGSFNMLLKNSDEAWTFSTIYQMYKGYTIYKELNVITTPLFYYIIKFVFEIFGVNFFVYRFCNIVINIIIYLTVYNILKRTIRNKTSSFLCTLLTYNICNSTLNAMSSYNTLAIMFYLIGILINLNEKIEKNCFLQGIIVFLVFMTKQNIGIYYIIGLTLITFFNCKTKEGEIIKYLKIIITFIIMLLIYCIYLLYNNNLYNFIDYCFIGISEFKNNIIFDFRIIFYALAICLSIFITFFLRKIINKDIIKLEILSLPMCLISYPIFNNAHIKFSIIGIVIVLMSIIEKMIIEELLNKSIIKKAIYITTILLISFSLYNFIMWGKYVINKKYISKELFGTIISSEDDIEKNIETITKYIENNNKRTIVLSPYSKLYTIILNYNNGIFDLPFIGNLGKEGEEGLIEKISELKDVSILIEKNEKNLIYQESIKAREYVQNNFENKGEIEQFYIYEK